MNRLKLTAFIYACLVLALTLTVIFNVTAPIYDSWTVTDNWNYYENGFNWTTTDVEPEPPPIIPPVIPPPPAPSVVPSGVNPVLLVRGINFRTNYSSAGFDYLTNYALRLDVQVSNFSFTGNALRLSRYDNLFYMNVTAGTSDLDFGLVYWFQSIGGSTETRFTANASANVDFYVGTLGEPSLIYGAASSTFNNQTNIVSLVTATGGDIRLIWRFDVFEQFFLVGLGLGGFVMIAIGSFWASRRVREFVDEGDIMAVGWALLIIIIGAGLLIVWLWP